MQDISRLIGSPVTITIRGEEITLTGMTLGDIGFMQAAWKEMKRKEIVDSVAAFKDAVDNADYMKMIAESRKEIREIGDASKDEFNEFIGTKNGMISLAHRLLTRQYPQKKYTREEAEMSCDFLAEMFADYIEASSHLQMGDDPAGNEAGPASK